MALLKTDELFTWVVNERIDIGKVEDHDPFSRASALVLADIDAWLRTEAGKVRPQGVDLSPPSELATGTIVARYADLEHYLTSRHVKVDRTTIAPNVATLALLRIIERDYAHPEPTPYNEAFGPVGRRYDALRALLTRMQDTIRRWTTA